MPASLGDSVNGAPGRAATDLLRFSRVLFAFVRLHTQGAGARLILCECSIASPIAFSGAELSIAPLYLGCSFNLCILALFRNHFRPLRFEISDFCVLIVPFKATFSLY